MRKRYLVFIFFFGGLLVPSCRREAEPTASRPAAEPVTAVQTYEHLRALHARRAYGAMRPYLEATQKQRIIDLLMAMDQLLLANHAALQAIKKACPNLATRPYDVSDMADHLELFSQNIKLINAREDGPRAEVTVQIAERLPLRHLEFQRRAGRWVYLPGPGGPQITGLLNDLATSLNRIARSVAEQAKNKEDVDNLYRLQLAPALRRLREATEQSGGSKR